MKDMNGIKIIAGGGTKMDAAFEAAIEEYMYATRQQEL